MKDKSIWIFVLLLGLMLVGIGGSELKDNLVPTALTWQQFIADKSDSGWFKISEVQLNVAEGIWVENHISADTGNCYVPARAAGDNGLNETGQYLPFKMMVKTNDPKIAATVKDLKELEKGTEKEAEAATMDYLLAHGEQLRVERTVVVGTVAKGFDAVDSGDEDAIRKADVALADNFVMLREGEKPANGGRVFTIIAGIGLSLLGLFHIFLKKPAPPAPPATASGFFPLSK